MGKENKSPLILDKLVFDNISFERLGFKNNKSLGPIRFNSKIAVDNEKNYRVSLSADLLKESEYKLNVMLSGFFRILADENVNEEVEKSLIIKNAVAIMMPYLRAEISLLTAQPEMDCIVMPPFNINNLMEEEEQDTQKNN